MSAELTRNGTSTPAEAPARAVTVTPRVDILETENEVLVLADLPGVKPDEVDVRFEKGELTIHGRRACCHGGKEAPLREYGAANYFRAFELAETIAADRIEAELKNGVLTLHLPKVEAVKPRRIAVKG
jgi:HSP20 family protein